MRTQTRRVQRAAVVGRDRLAPLGQDELELVGGRERVAIARAESRQELAQQLQCRLVVLLVGGGSVGGRALLAALDGADGAPTCDDRATTASIIVGDLITFPTASTQGPPPSSRSISFQIVS